MAQIFVPGVQVIPSVRVQRVRELPVPGEVLVEVGAIVAGSDVVAEAHLPGELHILRIPEQLGIEPFEVSKGLQVQEGDHVAAGQLLCEHSGLFGLFKSRYSAPCEGDIEFITPRTGHVGLRLAPRPICVDAYISGTVAAVAAGKSVTVEAEAALVQGIFGVGGEQRGVVTMLDVPRDAALRAEDLPDQMAGRVLVGGARPDSEVLQRASQAGAVGLVVGSIDDQALTAYLGYDLGIAVTGDEEVSMTMIVTEGFGQMAMAESTHTLLAECSGAEASINGATQVRAGAVRPEVIVCRSSSTSDAAPQLETPGLMVGSSVRLIRIPYFGLRGKVVELPHSPEQIESGALARVLRAELADGRVVTVPRANVELVSSAER